MKRNLKKLLYVFLILFLLVLLADSLTNHFKGYSDNYSIQIFDFHICLTTDEPISGSDKWIYELSKDQKEYFACGNLITTEYPIDLNIYVIQENEIKARSTNPFSERFNNGVFYSKLDMDRITTGNYKMIITKGRITLATFEFSVVD